MSRVIKFRAWSEEKKQMTYLESQYVSEALHYYENGSHSLMQFTGLVDKNGKEIYEGDILAPVNPPSSKKGNRVCEYVDGSFCYNEANTRGSRGFWPLTQMKCQLFAVIGNIYENPELLGV